MRALERTVVAPEQPKRAEAPPMVRARSRRARTIILVAAALTLAGVAGAARVTGVWSMLAPDDEPASVVETAAPPAPAPVAPKASPEIATAALDTAAASAPAPPPSVVASPPPSVVASPPAASKPVLAATAAQRDVPYPLPPPPATAAPDEAGGAGAEFALANTARRKGDHGRAILLYRDLLRDYPDAPEASPARVALARLLLDDGDAEGALRSFDAYLSGGDGALREEAMVGRARALGRLGRDGEERAAWSALLLSYPQSIHAERARARLEELGHR
jgi:TolA-binding protein